MTTRLVLYNKALRYCGEKSLASLTEAREPRYLLDAVWSNGGVNYCLEQGFWNWCSRFVRFDYDTSVTPQFGHNRAFQKPTDYVKTCGVCSDEFFTTPLLDYNDLTGYWYASIDQIYVQYVSNGTSYGQDLSIWPESFTNFAAAYFASEIVHKLTSDENKQTKVEKMMEKYLKDAKSLDGSATPQQFPATGFWARSRSGGRSNRDRGNRGNLIG